MKRPDIRNRVVTFDCGHECYVTTWATRARQEKREKDGKYWKDQSIPQCVGAVAPCPECPRKTLRHVVKVEVSP